MKLKTSLILLSSTNLYYNEFTNENLHKKVQQFSHKLYILLKLKPPKLLALTHLHETTGPPEIFKINKLSKMSARDVGGH